MFHIQKSSKFQNQWVDDNYAKPKGTLQEITETFWYLKKIAPLEFSFRVIFRVKGEEDVVVAPHLLL